MYRPTDCVDRIGRRHGRRPRLGGRQRGRRMRPPGGRLRQRQPGPDPGLAAADRPPGRCDRGRGRLADPAARPPATATSSACVRWRPGCAVASRKNCRSTATPGRPRACTRRPCRHTAGGSVKAPTCPHPRRCSACIECTPAGAEPAADAAPPGGIRVCGTGPGVATVSPARRCWRSGRASPSPPGADVVPVLASEASAASRCRAARPRPWRRPSPSHP